MYVMRQLVQVTESRKNMNIKSSKAKGRKLQNLVRDELNSCGYHTRATLMGESGVDVSGYDCEWGVECKAVEALNVWAALEQAEHNAKERNLIPALAFKRNRTDAYITLRLSDFIELVKQRNTFVIRANGPQLPAGSA